MRCPLPRLLTGARVAAVTAALPATAACGGGGSGSDAADKGTGGDAARAEAPAQPAVVDPASVGADELGAVPVLMYHQIVASPASVYDRTPQDFRAELERLAREKYVPITAAEYATGRIDIPAGTHPVVLTFDDSTISQFALGPDGAPAPGTAVAILTEVARANPGFRPVATFFVNSDPFNDPGGKVTLPWLRDHGFEVGNHTFGHANLRSSGADAVAKQIADQQTLITQALPGTNVETLALPFGAIPRPADLAAKGASGGVSYQHKGVFLVGSNPAPSPFAATFEPGAVPRIRSQAATGAEARFGSTAWLDKLASGEVRRYTSDGDPQTIAYPTGAAAPSVAYTGQARPY